MKIFLSIIILLAIEDLGVLTDQKVIMLSKPTNRVDCPIFYVQIQAQDGSFTFFTKTNDSLKLADFSSLPQGKATLGIQSICSDGSRSEMTAYTIDIRRDPPSAPKAAILTLLNTNTLITLSSHMEFSREKLSTNIAPTPFDPPPQLPRSRMYESLPRRSE